MRHKTSGYFLLSALLVSLILGLCILLNLRCPQAVSDDALTQEQLTRGVTLTGWQQTGPGHWRFAFEAPADVPELVLCLSTRSLDAVPEGLEPTDQRGEAFWVRPVPGRTSEITVTSTTVPQMWLMLPDTLWHWRELRSSLQLMALVAFASMGAGILALFCFKPKHELGVFLLYLGVMFGWGLAVLFPAGQTGALLGFLMGLNILLRFCFRLGGSLFAAAFAACLPAARRFGLGCHLFRGGSFGLLGLFRLRFWFLRGFCILGFAFLFLRARFAVRSIAIAGMGFGHPASPRAWSGFALRALPAPGFGLWLLRRLHRSLCYLLFVHRFLHQHLRFIVALTLFCYIVSRYKSPLLPVRAAAGSTDLLPMRSSQIRVCSSLVVPSSSPRARLCPRCTFTASSPNR